MTAEQQLERSVLEGKERDELSAIAQAMSLKTTTRTKKADIIDRILDATGVTSNGEAHGANGASNGDSPSGTANGTANGTKPSRRPRAAATVATEPEASSGAATVTESPKADESGAGAPGDNGPAVFVEPPELSDGNDAGAPQQNGQSAPAHQQNRNRPNQVSRIRTIETTRTTRTTRTTTRATGATSATGVGAGGVGVSARRGELQGAVGKSSRIQAKWSKSKACSTCATKATVFCAAVVTCHRPRTSTSPSARRVGLPCARVTTSRARAARRRTMRSIRHCCASTPCPGSTPKRRATGPLRGSHSLVPRLPPASRNGRGGRQGQPDRAHRRSALAHRQGQRGLIVSPPKAGRRQS